MSGHSKWSQIKRQKGTADAKRSATFSKLAKAVSIAARHGTDPEANFQLRIAIDQARAANMPKDNIDRAIERVKNADEAQLEEITFEAYGPSGTAFLIETTTDNRNRTIGEIRAALNKYDGKLAESGSVGYLFSKYGLLIVPANDNAEEIELAAIEADAEDVEIQDDKVFVSTAPTKLEAIRSQLASNGFVADEAELGYRANMTIEIAEQQQAQKATKLYEVLDELDDVAQVYGNFELVSEP